MLLILCALLCVADKAEVILAPTGSKSDHSEVQAGGLMLREGEVGAAFGTVKVGKGKRQMTYFLVVKHDLSKSEKTDFTEEANADDDSCDSKQTLTLDGRTIEIVYKLRTDKDKKGTETLTITNKTKKESLELKKGRVLLVDLTATPPTWEQRKVDLPEEVEAANKKATEDLAKKVLASIAKQDKKSKEFIDKPSR
jgi:hypothetical protein